MLFVDLRLAPSAPLSRGDDAATSLSRNTMPPLSQGPSRLQMSREGRTYARCGGGPTFALYTLSGRYCATLSSPHRIPSPPTTISTTTYDLVCPGASGCAFEKNHTQKMESVNEGGFH
jgi:hypothetical protein